MDDDSGRASRFGPARIIDRLVVAAFAEHRGVAERGEPAQILHRGGRCHAQGERGGIRRHDQVRLFFTFQGQRRDAKGSILIDVMPVEGTEGRFRNAPWHAVLPAIGDLTAHRVLTSAIDQ